MNNHLYGNLIFELYVLADVVILFHRISLDTTKFLPRCGARLMLNYLNVTSLP